ncbi:uncharacterized protein BDW70DRAFT_43710 [Aspergillus foveolatus]|uniref:uncharacterized protein n=1 Tax=Aspergillus foveolatus TaxID=210207 RepID=UPI003CCE313E
MCPTEKSTEACRYNMVLGSYHYMVFNRVCATLPTLPQAYAAILHKRSSYYDTSNYRSGKSEPKHPSIRLQLLPDASLFETVAAEERGSSHVNILDKDGKDGMRIQKTTEVSVVRESKGSTEVEEGHDPKYFFPNRIPLEAPGGVSLPKN